MLASFVRSVSVSRSVSITGFCSPVVPDPSPPHRPVMSPKASEFQCQDRIVVSSVVSARSLREASKFSMLFVIQLAEPTESEVFVVAEPSSLTWSPL